MGLLTGEIEQHIHSGFPVEKHHVDDVRERFSFHVVEETRDAAFVERRGRCCCFFFLLFVSLSPKKLPLLRRRRIHIVSASDDRGERKCEEFVLGCVSSIIIQRSLTLILILKIHGLARVTLHLRIANHLVMDSYCRGGIVHIRVGCIRAQNIPP